MLLPARTDTKWFHKYIYGKAEIRFIAGRLHFQGSENSAPFPSMVCIWRGNNFDKGGQMKTVLVLDRMPDRCFDCPLGRIGDTDICPATGTQESFGKKLDLDNYTDKKPDWCPLKKLPEYRTITDDSVSCDFWIDGYNQCLNDILDTQGGNTE